PGGVDIFWHSGAGPAYAHLFFCRSKVSAQGQYNLGGECTIWSCLLGTSVALLHAQPLPKGVWNNTWSAHRRGQGACVAPAFDDSRASAECPTPRDSYSNFLIQSWEER